MLSLSVSPYVIIFGFLLLGLYIRIANQYINAAREVKRINSVSHSPIYDQFSSVLSGLSTIRAFGRVDFYMDRMLDLIDNSTKASWALQLSARWMSDRMSRYPNLPRFIVSTGHSSRHIHRCGRQRSRTKVSTLKSSSRTSQH